MCPSVRPSVHQPSVLEIESRLRSVWTLHTSPGRDYFKETSGHSSLLLQTQISPAIECTTGIWWFCEICRTDRQDRRGRDASIWHLQIFLFESFVRYDLCSKFEDKNETLTADASLLMGCVHDSLIAFNWYPSNLSEIFIANLKNSLQHCAEAITSHKYLSGDLNMPRVVSFRWRHCTRLKCIWNLCNYRDYLSQFSFFTSTKHVSFSDVILCVLTGNTSAPPQIIWLFRLAAVNFQYFSSTHKQFFHPNWLETIISGPDHGQIRKSYSHYKVLRTCVCSLSKPFVW